MAHCDTKTVAPKHVRVENAFRHWSPESESYPPAEVLLQFIRLGWALDELVAVETFYYSGYRTSDIYHFTLTRGEMSIEIPVLANPAVFRVVASCHLTVVKLTVAREPVTQH